MRYLITFSYNGSKFDGYQRQNNLRTVQGDIEKVLYIINKKDVKLISSGRTDKGVHAINQKAHFDLSVNIDCSNLKRVLNNRLSNIFIKDVNIVDDTFHARYDVKEKTYIYFINTGEFDVFNEDYVYQFCKSLDIDKMNEGLSYILGTHDFRGFCKDEKIRENCVRTIYRVSLIENDDIIKISITGSGFLRKMVRNIIGALIEIGMHKKEPKYVFEILDKKGVVHNTKSVPGCSLYLKDVIYK